MTAENILFALLRSVVCGETIDEKEADLWQPEQLAKVFTLAKKHDLTHLAAHGLESLGIPEAELESQFKAAKKLVLYRYLQQERDSERIYRKFTEAGIDFIPLKGAVLRQYYPEPWMRIGCDIDVLVPENLLEDAAAVLTERLSYRYHGRDDHDLSFFSPSGNHVELHYMAVDEGRFEKAQNVLKRMWEDASALDPSGCHKVLSDEMFYFYHIVHMAKHIENGGCGIRPFLDLWILNHRMDGNLQKRRKLLQEGDLIPFAEAVEKQTEIWFSQKQPDAMSQCLTQFVLQGGVYGVLENQIVVHQTKLGSKGRYVLRKIFLPYDRLKYHYPILQKYRFLTPVFEVVRWLKLLFKGGIRRSAHELKINANVSGNKAEEVESLMRYLGI